MEAVSLEMRSYSYQIPYHLCFVADCKAEESLVDGRIQGMSPNDNKARLVGTRLLFPVTIRNVPSLKVPPFFS